MTLNPLISEGDKYSNLHDEKYLSIMKKISLTIVIINSLFFIAYILSFTWGIDYFNYNEDPYTVNLFYNMGREFYSNNCDHKFPIGISKKPKKNYEKTIEIPKDSKICLDNIFSMDFKQALSDENIAKLLPTFNLTCWDRFHFMSNDKYAICPISYINGIIINNFLIDGEIYYLNGNLVFGYEDRIKVKKNCGFIDDINPEYTRKFLPFVFLIFVFGFLVLEILMWIFLTKSTKDDKSRPPKSTQSYTSTEVVGTVNTVRVADGRVLKSKDVYGDVRRVKVYYHQIPWTGSDRRLQIASLLLSSLLMSGILFYYSQTFYVYYSQVTMVVKLGNDMCFEDDKINNHFSNNYSQGFDVKLMVLGLMLLGFSLINFILFCATFIITLFRISFLEIIMLK